MKHLLIAAAAAALATSALAEPMSEANLRQLVSPNADPTVFTMFGVSYLAGVMEAGEGTNHCAPKLTPRELAPAVAARLKEKRANSQIEPAAPHVLELLKETYPCK